MQYFVDTALPFHERAFELANANGSSKNILQIPMSFGIAQMFSKFKWKKTVNSVFINLRAYQHVRSLSTVS